MDEMTFWDSYYPTRIVLDSVTGQEKSTGGDAMIEFITPFARERSAVERMAKERQQQLFNLARLRSIVKPYLDAVAPKQGWKPAVR